MKPENWTDCEHPCFADYDADPMAMTKEMFIAEAEKIVECDDAEHCFHPCPNGVTCEDGWHNCPYGALSKHCDWLPKEGTNA